MSNIIVCIVAPVHIWDDVRVYQKQAVSLVENGYKVVLLARVGKSRVAKGVCITRVWSWYSSRFLRFVSLPLVFLQAMRSKADIYHLHNPDTLPIAFMLRVCGKKVIYDVHEDFGLRVLMRDWIPKLLRNTVAKVSN